jgi:hypothetical protein
MSEVKVNKISPRSGTDVTLGDASDTFTIPASATLDVNGTIDVTGATVTGLSAGKVLQVVTLQYNTIETHSAGESWQNTGLSAAITPASTSNKVLVLISANIGVNTYGFTNIVRDSTALNQGTGAGDRITCTTMGGTYGSHIPWSGTISLLDSPSTTSATTYLLAVYGYNGGNVYLNRSWTDTDYNYQGRGSSSITLMEIEG